MYPISNPVLEALKTLMEKQSSWGDEFPGIPFVNSDSEFGVSCGTQNGHLYAINHLLESLELSNFFDGHRSPETDIDTLVYTFGVDHTVNFYEGVSAHRTKDGMQLTILTNKPIIEIVNAIELGIAEAQSHLDRRAEESANHARNLRKEFSKENVFPLFSVREDISFVRAYLQQKIGNFFRGQPETEVYGPLESHYYLKDIFSDYGIVDTRPRFTVLVPHTENDYSPFNDLINDVLNKVFTCPQAVNGKIEENPQQGTERLIAFRTAAIQKPEIDASILSIEVKGNPSRLVRDIIKNDPEIAKLITIELKLSIPEDDNYGLVEKDITQPPAIGAKYPPLQLG